MIDISVETDNKLDKLAKRFPNEVKKGVKKARIQAVREGKKALTKQIAQIYKAPKVAKEIKTKQNAIIAAGRMLTIGDTHFSALPRIYKSQEGIKVARRKRVKVTIKKGNKKTLKHAFIANPETVGGHTMVWQGLGRPSSKNPKKEAIAPVKTVATAEMANKYAEVAIEKMEETYKQIIAQCIERELKK